MIFLHWAFVRDPFFFLGNGKIKGIWDGQKHLVSISMFFFLNVFWSRS